MVSFIADLFDALTTIISEIRRSGAKVAPPLKLLKFSQYPMGASPVRQFQKIPIYNIGRIIIIVIGRRSLLPFTKSWLKPF